MFTVGNSEMAEKHNYKVNVIFAGGVTMHRWRRLRQVTGWQQTPLSDRNGRLLAGCTSWLGLEGLDHGPEQTHLSGSF